MMAQNRRRHSGCGGALLARRGIAHRPGRLSVAADHAAGAVPARRQRRHGDPAGGGEGRRQPQGDHRHRQPQRRRRQHRGAGHQGGGARRLHAVPHQHGRDVGQSDPLSGDALRSGQGLPADHADHLVSAHPGGAARQPGEDGRRPRGAREDQARRIELRLAGRRLRRADPRRDVQGPRSACRWCTCRTGARRPPRPTSWPAGSISCSRPTSRSASRPRPASSASSPSAGRSASTPSPEFRPWRRRATPASISRCGTAWWRRGHARADRQAAQRGVHQGDARARDILRIVEPQATDVFVTTPEEFGQRIAATPSGSAKVIRDASITVK